MPFDRETFKARTGFVYDTDIGSDVDDAFALALSRTVRTVTKIKNLQKMPNSSGMA